MCAMYVEEIITKYHDFEGETGLEITDIEINRQVFDNIGDLITYVLEENFYDSYGFDGMLYASDSVQDYITGDYDVYAYCVHTGNLALDIYIQKLAVNMCRVCTDTRNQVIRYINHFFEIFKDFKEIMELVQ